MSEVFSLPFSLFIVAFVLDLLIGDPKWLPHPVRIIGRAISKTETILRRVFKTPFQEKVGGVLLAVGITLLTLISTIFLVLGLNFIATTFQGIALIPTILLVYLTSTTIATKELISAGQSVISSNIAGDIESARANLSMIVGRDTHELSEKDILKATIETLSENLSDGIVAPLFYLAIGGIPAAMVYKAINTLDSMVGYRNDRYINFGWASARLDDIANYIPARISGILIAISSLFVFRSLSRACDSFRTLIEDGKKHLSPNAGIPEAAIAGALGVRLGGPSTYNGTLVQKPYIGKEKTTDYLMASKRAIEIIRLSSFIAAGVVGAILYANR